MTIEWIWPLSLLLLPLPLLFSSRLPRVNQPTVKLKVAHLQYWPDNQNSSSGTQSSTAQRVLKILLWLSWISLVIALARPQLTGDPIELPVKARDLMLAVDISQSMSEKDMTLDRQTVDRLQAVKFVLRDFIERRVGDRLGLILFGSNAYLQAPLTFDRRTVNTLLDESALGLAGKRTAIGDAIALGAKRLQDQELESRVIVLLTDGANTAGKLAPMTAAKLAKDLNVKIYTIGLGADRMEINTFFGTREVNPSRDLDEKTLQEIADLTGGQFFRARNPEQLEQIYQLIDQLEPSAKDPQIYRPIKAIGYWFLTGSLLGLLLLTVIRWVLQTPLVSQVMATNSLQGKTRGKTHGTESGADYRNGNRNGHV